jgi:hypothetical protein
MLLQWSRKTKRNKIFKSRTLQSSLYTVGQYESIMSEKYQLSIKKKSITYQKNSQIVLLELTIPQNIFPTPHQLKENKYLVVNNISESMNPHVADFK